MSDNIKLLQNTRVDMSKVTVTKKQYDDYLGLWIDLPFSEEEVDSTVPEKPLQGVQSIVGSLIADTSLFVCMLLSGSFMIMSFVPYVNH